MMAEMGDQGSAAFIANHRVLHGPPFIDVPNRSDNGGGILFKAVADRNLRVTRFGSIVINTQTASNVYDLHVGTETDQFVIYPAYQASSQRVKSEWW
ncbi:hypothetical protein ACFX12_010403 [Malus domestica]